MNFWYNFNMSNDKSKYAPLQVFSIEITLKVNNLADLEIAGGIEQQVGRFEVTVQYVC